MAYLPRIVDRELRKALQSFPIVVLDGARAIGKTTTAEQVTESAIRLPHDLPLLEFDAAETLHALPAPVLIDEWQLAGVELLWTLKQLVDADPTPGRFVLTGSVEPATYGPTYPLTGRAVRLMMYPMTEQERGGLGHGASFLGNVFAGAYPTVGEVHGTFDSQRLFSTGFPAAREQPEPAMFLEAYAALLSQRAGAEGRDANRLLRALSVLGVLTGEAVPDKRIWDAADINKATWSAYKDLLARTHITGPLPAFSSNRLKRLTSYPKWLLADTALALAVANVRREDLQSNRTLVGHYLESFVVQQLRPHAQTLGAQMSHIRTGSEGREIDLLVEVAGRFVAFEVKGTSRPNGDDAKHLRWLRGEIGESLDYAAVLHTGGDTYRLDDDNWALPITALVPTSP